MGLCLSGNLPNYLCITIPYIVVGDQSKLQVLKEDLGCVPACHDADERSVGDSYVSCYRYTSNDVILGLSYLWNSYS